MSFSSWLKWRKIERIFNWEIQIPCIMTTIWNIEDISSWYRLKNLVINIRSWECSWRIIHNRHKTIIYFKTLDCTVVATALNGTRNLTTFVTKKFDTKSRRTLCWTIDSDITVKSRGASRWIIHIGLRTSKPPN
jgi:hypothetical protein